MRFTQLHDWLAWQEGLHSREIELGLDRVCAVAQRMGLTDVPAKVVCVAGTNGKGSCVATLEALCLGQGLSVGAFTSPHLQRYNERIRVDGVEVDDFKICQAFEAIDQARGEISLTYFEFGTLAALEVFRRCSVDVMLLEVGLGGRLDAVNIIDADVSVVTSIALDHEDWLGSDLGVIGFEKAGIYRANRWAICADDKAPTSVADYAHDIGAYWVAMGMSMNVSLLSPERWCWSGVKADGSVITLDDLALPNLPLPSVAAALQAFLLLGYELPVGIAGVLAKVELAGRAQSLTWQGVNFLLDVAHNPAAAKLLADRLAATCGVGRTHCIVAMMSDKDRVGVFEALIPVVDSWSVAALPDNSRAASASALQQDLSSLGQHCRSYTSVAEAATTMAAEAHENDRVVIMGSFFTVSQALSLFDL